MPARKEFTKSDISAVKMMAKMGYTIVDMAKELNVNRSVIYRLIKENDIEMTMNSKNKVGKKYDWTPEKIEKLKQMYASDEYSLEDIYTFFQTSESTIVKKAKDLQIKKTPKAFFSKEILEYLEKNNNVLTTTEMAVHLKMNPWTVVKQLKKMGIYNKEKNNQLALKKSRNSIGSNWYKKEIYFKSPEFVLDLGNPMYSHTYIARKYDLAVSAVKKWRIEKYGSWKGMVDTYLCKSSSEMEFEEILEELKLSYLYEYIVKDWKIDYYLGFNLLIEIQGSHWHDELEKVIEKDKRKFEDLENSGYTVVQFWDYEIKDEKEKVKSILLQKLKNCIDNYYSSFTQVS